MSIQGFIRIRLHENLPGELVQKFEISTINVIYDIFKFMVTFLSLKGTCSDNHFFYIMEIYV